MRSSRFPVGGRRPFLVDQLLGPGLRPWLYRGLPPPVPPPGDAAPGQTGFAPAAPLVQAQVAAPRLKPGSIGGSLLRRLAGLRCSWCTPTWPEPSVCTSGDVNSLRGRLPSERRRLQPVAGSVPGIARDFRWERCPAHARFSGCGPNLQAQRIPSPPEQLRRGVVRGAAAPCTSQVRRTGSQLLDSQEGSPRARPWKVERSARPGLELRRPSGATCGSAGWCKRCPQPGRDGSHCGARGERARWPRSPGKCRG
jgi:hypothetical protein